MLSAEVLSLYYYYVGWFLALLIVLWITRALTSSSAAATTAASATTAADASSSSASITKLAPTSEFKRFQTTYIIVFLVMMAADWMQGPYVYALYSHYGFDIQEIGLLFIVGFGSSLVFGTVVGSMADRYGRKKLCIAFGVMYSLSCMTKHFADYRILMVGRLLGGISTSILFSSFESWMVHEHHSHNYHEEWLGLTFSIGTSGNGIVAIASGVVASIVRDEWGPVAPFDVSLILLIIGTTIIIFTWTENTGDASINIRQTLSHAFLRLKQDKKIAYLGIIQSFFEGSMYVFVFMWTPALTSTSQQDIYHGWIFASFMICVLIGSTLFAYCIDRAMRVERMALYMFAVAAVSLLLPAFTVSHSLRFFSFCVFEVCVGLFWPSLGFMRSRYVPEEVRATVMNIFRIPLNLIVVLVLINIAHLSEFQVFLTCFGCMVPTFLCQYQLCTMVLDTPHINGKKGEGTLPIQVEEGETLINNHQKELPEL